MVRTEEQHEEQVLMNMIANNNAPNDPPKEQDQREADSYLNMSGDGIEGEEQPIAQTSNDGQQSEV